MRALLLIIGIICLSSPNSTIRAEDVSIRTDRAEVRSGPSPEYYVTGYLSRGETVSLIPSRHGREYLAIAPPRGEFNLIRMDAVNVGRNGKLGVVKQDGTETLVGSRSRNYSVKGSQTLSMGHQVQIMNSVEDGNVTYYSIVPPGDPNNGDDARFVGEVRYIHVSAVRDVTTPPRRYGGGANETGYRGGLGSARTSYKNTMAGPLQEADEAFRQARTSGNWAHAESLYKKLSQCDDHEARMEAWNRLEFIRQRKEVGYSPAPASSVRRHRTSFQNYRGTTSRPPAQFVRNRQIVSRPAMQRVPYRGLPGRPENYVHARDSFRPARQKSIKANLAPAANARRSQSRYPASRAGNSSPHVGRLQRSSQQLTNGRPLYLLVNSLGQVKCYVEPSQGLELESYLGQVVELSGGPMEYHRSLRKDYLTAAQVQRR